jgi:hypothetical protein
LAERETTGALKIGDEFLKISRIRHAV